MRQHWIENLVLEQTAKLLQDEVLLDCIAENTYQYYLSQNTNTSYTKSLQKALEDTENSIRNLLRAVEAGLFSESTKIRLDELESQKNELKTALAAAKLKENLGLKKEHILFFLHQFADMDLQDIDCQRRLIKTFVNSVFVYDDKVILTFTYSSDHRTITLKELDAGMQESVRISPSDWYGIYEEEIRRIQCNSPVDCCLRGLDRVKPSFLLCKNVNESPRICAFSKKYSK